MTQRAKRSISLPPELADRIDRAAAAAGTTFSAWLAETAVRQLRLEAGRAALSDWEREHGALTSQELAAGLATARHLLGPPESA
ncbi:MAG: hypothetical protein ABR573_10355 [Candidatus Dormibacteria bacterium]